MIKSLWAAVQGDPIFMRRTNGWLTVGWMTMIPVSFATGWVKSVAYVSALSLWGRWSPVTGRRGKQRASRSHRNRTRSAAPSRTSRKTSSTAS